MKHLERLTKEALLEITLGGWLYIITIFTNLEKLSDTKCKPVINHLRGEKNASLSFTFRNNKWYMYDFGDPAYRGDVFNLYALVNGIEDVKGNFVEIMQGIYRDTFNEEPPTYNKEKKQYLTEGKLAEGLEYHFVERADDNLSKADQQFLNKYQLSTTTLEKLNMSFLDNYTFRANSGKVHTAHAVDDRVFIVHKFGPSAKVYKPNDEQYRYYFMGYYPTDYFVGKEQIELLVDRVEKDDTIKDEKIIIVLCAGGKDAMTATELGFVAISLNSETSTFVPNYVINAVDDMCKILNKPVEVKIVYDLDQTGETMAYEIAEKLDKRFTKASVVKLPQKLADAGGKDISDWVALGLDKEELITIIGGEDYNADAHKSIDEKYYPVSPVSAHGYDNTTDDTSSMVEEPEIWNSLTNDKDKLQLFETYLNKKEPSIGLRKLISVNLCHKTLEAILIEHPDCVKWLSSDTLYQNCIDKLKLFDNGKEYLKSKGIKTNV